jgi:uncharacterized membrane protein YhiD involved in acid resistance
MALTLRRLLVVAALAAILAAPVFPAALAAEAQPAPPLAASAQPAPPLPGQGPPPAQPVSEWTTLVEAAIRLPVAAALGAALAFRPRRRGTPPRTAAVIQTQIILAVVGCLIMLIVGTSLARAFGIVGAAGLIRYRAKIEDPKDAAVMLATLGVGLAAGVGLHLIALFATLFILGLLLLVESLQEGFKRFELTITTEQLGGLRPRIETLFRRQHIGYELRTASEHEICYEVSMPLDAGTERVTDAILRLDPKGATTVQWDEKKVKP